MAELEAEIERKRFLETIGNLSKPGFPGYRGFEELSNIDGVSPDIFMQFDSVSMLVAGKTCTKPQKLEQPCTQLKVLQMRLRAGNLLKNLRF